MEFSDSWIFVFLPVQCVFFESVHPNKENHAFSSQSSQQVLSPCRDLSTHIEYEILKSIFMFFHESPGH